MPHVSINSSCVKLEEFILHVVLEFKVHRQITLGGFSQVSLRPGVRQYNSSTYE